jgi:hypothetical protein
VFGHPEVGFGLVPGGGSIEALPGLAGRPRALEIILGGEDFDADTASGTGGSTAPCRTPDSPRLSTASPAASPALSRPPSPRPRPRSKSGWECPRGRTWRRRRRCSASPGPGPARGGGCAKPLRKASRARRLRTQPGRPARPRRLTSITAHPSGRFRPGAVRGPARPDRC